MTTTGLLQPHEGIRGTGRDPNDPLLTERGSDVVLALTDLLYSASLVNAPSAVELFHRLRAPVEGRPVISWDAARSRSADSRYKGVGYLLAHRREWGTGEEEWRRAVAAGEVYADAERWVEPDAWYIQYGPEPVDVCRWTNCTVLAIPLEELS